MLTGCWRTSEMLMWDKIDIFFFFHFASRAQFCGKWYSTEAKLWRVENYKKKEISTEFMEFWLNRSQALCFAPQTVFRSIFRFFPEKYIQNQKSFFLFVVSLSGQFIFDAFINGIRTNFKFSIRQNAAKRKHDFLLGAISITNVARTDATNM